MKSKLLSILSLLLVAVTQGAWALNGSGTLSNPYLITSVDDWNALASQTSYGAGKYYRLMDDISVTTPLNRNAVFKGTFDGNGHTIPLTHTTTEKYDGLFPYIENLTVKNLHVAGTITTSNECAGGISGYSTGNCYIQNCRVSVTINSTFEGDAWHSGFVATVKGTGNVLFISNCSFDGVFNGSSSYRWGGFISWADQFSGGNISNSYFRPSGLNIALNDEKKSHPFMTVSGQCSFAKCLYSFYYACGRAAYSGSPFSFAFCNISLSRLCYKCYTRCVTSVTSGV